MAKNQSSKPTPPTKETQLIGSAEAKVREETQEAKENAAASDEHPPIDDEQEREEYDPGAPTPTLSPDPIVPPTEPPPINPGPPHARSSATNPSPPSPDPLQLSSPPQPNDADRLAAAKRGRSDTTASIKQRSEAEVREANTLKELEQTRGDLVVSQRKCRALEKELAELKLATAHGARPLTAQEVREKLQMDPRIEFRVLERYTHMNAVLPQHRILRGKLYPQLVAYVQNGLKLVEHAPGR